MARAQLRHTVRDTAGNVIENALVRVYEQGTTTPVADLYTAVTGGSPVTTLTSNNQGEVVGYLTTGRLVDLSVTDNSAGAHYPATVNNKLSWTAFTETVPATRVGTDELVPKLRRPDPPRATVITSFQAGHGFTNDGTVGSTTAADDTAVKVIGGQSFRVTSSGAGGTARISRIGGSAVDYTGKQIEVWLRFTDISRLASAAFFLGGSSFASHWRWDFLSSAESPNFFLSGEWAVFTLNWQDAAVVGTPNRAAITDTRIAFTDNNSGTGVTVYANAIITRPEPASAFPNGVVTFTFDDGWDTIYTEGLKVLSQYGFPGTVYPVIESVGQAGQMTLAQLRELQDLHGWEVGAHASTWAIHDARFTSLTGAALDAEMVANKSWLLANGFTRGADQLAYPGGQYNAAVIASARKFFGAGRGQFIRIRETAPTGDAFKIRSRSLGSGTSLATAQTLLTNAKNNKGWVNFTLHKLAATSADSLTWSIANFQTLVAQAATDGMAVRTMGDVLTAV